jgi:preprotein translocase subunit YajC
MGTPAEGGGAPLLVSLLPILAMFAIMYFVVMRPEQKKRAEHDALLKGLKRNDQVVLASGIHGRVMQVGEAVLTIEIAPRVQVQVDATSIQRVTKGPSGAEKKEEKA